MKRMLFALFALFLTTACFRSHLNSPGLTAEGLSPKLPSPAYGQLENDSKSLDYNYLLANKELDYEMTKYNMVMDYELKMKMAWQACLKQESQETCMMIHGGWPYYMSYMGMYGYGYPYTGMPGFYPGCPYQDASYCMTYFETMQYMQTQGANLGAAYQTERFPRARTSACHCGSRGRDLGQGRGSGQETGSAGRAQERAPGNHCRRQATP